MTAPTLLVPSRLEEACRRTPQRAEWLAALPEAIQEVTNRWSLSLGPPFEAAGCAWVAPAVRADDTAAVLKFGMPHKEGEHEIDGLRFWDGDPTVRLLEADADLNAMLLERCTPGTPLRDLPEEDQDVVIAGLLRRLWRTPPGPHPFRLLSDMTRHWSDETLAASEEWRDAGIVHEGLRLFEELPRTSSENVLLATDLHAGNVLRANREPWLVIDPKPFIGDPAYDATQHLLNCRARLQSDPFETIHRFADLLQADRERVRWWTFARLATEIGEFWKADDALPIARALAP